MEFLSTWAVWMEDASIWVAQPNSLKDVILQLEPMLFERVTGLTKHDFALLVSLNVFNEPLMNDAVYKFKRYEDSSLSYAGIDRHEGEQKVGGYDTVVTVDEYLSEK